ncbi:DNA polymerase III subunit beta [Wolbachia endosymbiont of Chironomus riparius]|uniref:DNA polymerase III subunit beta n=1 Tax=Wolbachia endosymbiont of Chironomus riparius TaxID=2883238 RepID=UPI00209EDDFB|nr:DNA polymerase III subunit beta [Wolbachia endosymbiont of Chironomus riparius]
MSEIIEINKIQSSVSEKICFSVSRTSLLNTLSKVSGVVERRNTIDVLACISIRAEYGIIKFMATDLDISILASLPANILADGEVKVSAHTLHDIVRKLPTDLDVNFKVSNQGKLLISCGNANFSLPNVVSSKFPLLEKDDYEHDFNLLNTDLLDFLNKTKFSVSMDDTRYNLNGVYIHTDQQFLCCVATDGHRLSCVKKAKPNEIQKDFSIIIPRKTVIELLKILDENNTVNVKLSERKVKFTCGEYTIISKLIDGIFPDYKSVIPVFQDKCMIIESKKLLDVVDRVSVVVTDKIKSIKFSLQENKLTLHSKSQECHDATESIDINYVDIPLGIGFNSRYILDALSCIKDKCKFSFIDNNSAAMITDENDPDVLYIIMPIRI